MMESIGFPVMSFLAPLVGAIIGGVLLGVLRARLVVYGHDDLTARRHTVKLGAILAMMSATLALVVVPGAWALILVGLAFFILSFYPDGLTAVFVLGPVAVMFTLAAGLTPLIFSTPWFMSPWLVLAAVPWGVFSGVMMLTAFKGINAEEAVIGVLLTEHDRIQVQLRKRIARPWTRALSISYIIFAVGVALAGVVYIILATQAQELTGLSSIVVVLAITPVFLLLFGAALYWTVALGSSVPTYFLVFMAIGAEQLASIVQAVTQPGMILARFPEAICDSCFLFSRPLASSYEEGRRQCEKCDSEISFGGPGKLVAVVGRRSDESLGRIFVRHPRSLLSAGRVVDLTHIVLPEKMKSSKEVESLVTFLVNNPPTHGLSSVRVFAPGGWDEMLPYLRNLLENKFGVIEEDPLVVSVD